MPRAVVCRELGAPEKLRVETACAMPLAPGKVRVAVRAAGINFPDILMVAGEYQFKPDLPFTPGMEAAGDVIEVGKDARGFKAKDRVIVKLRHGGYADEVAVTPEHLVPLPSTFDYAEGATFLAAHGTAYHALVDRAQIKPGEVLLVHGAGGGVGLAAVEIGKLLGATVIAVASSKEKLAVAQARGADHCIQPGHTPLRDLVKGITEGRGVDVVFDPVGGAAFEESTADPIFCNFLAAAAVAAISGRRDAGVAKLVDATDLKCVGLIVFATLHLQTGYAKHIRIDGTKRDLQNIYGFFLLSNARITRASFSTCRV